MRKKLACAIAFAAALVSSTSAMAWTLEQAAEPYKGTSIKAIFLDRPGYAAAIKLLPEFEKKTGIKVNYEIVPYENSRERQVLDFTGGGEIDPIGETLAPGEQVTISSYTFTHDKDGNQLLEEQIYDHESGQLVGGTPTFHVKGTPARSTDPLDGSRRRSRQTTFTKAYNIIALPNHTLADIREKVREAKITRTALVIVGDGSSMENTPRRAYERG